MSEPVVNPAAMANPHIRALTRMIDASPEVPVNYVLRGEEWLIYGDVGRARHDFEQARAQAERLLGASAWGYVIQAYIDRADAGLRQCDMMSDRYSETV